MGICVGLAGATGMLGTLLFTRLRRRLGLQRTGLIAFTAEVSCLSLAVVSVWTPGSPFDIHFASRPASSELCNVTENVTSSSSCGETAVAGPRGVNASIVLLLVGIISSRVGKHRARVTMCLSVCLSVCHKPTLYPHGSPGTLVF